MCEALVQRNPSATNRNSPANRTATTNPERHQTPGNHTSRMIHFPISQTRAAAIPERTATCMIGAMSPTTAFIATCWAPQMRHRRTITAVAVPSTGFLTYRHLLSLIWTTIHSSLGWANSRSPAATSADNWHRLFLCELELVAALWRNPIVGKYASRYKSCVFSL